jgi:hypothetical protein
VSFKALAALTGIDQAIDARRAQGFEGQTPDEIGSSALLILYTLASYAGSDGSAYPSQKTLALRCRLNERTVRGILSALESWGLIERIGRTRKDGTWTSDLIRLTYYEAEDAFASGDDPAGLRPAGQTKVRGRAASEEKNQRVSGPQDQRQVSTAPAGVRPDPTTFEPVTQSVSLSAHEPANPVRGLASQGLAGERVPVPPEIRDLAIRHPQGGEAWARSWIDPCAWDPDENAIVPRTTLQRGRIRELLGRMLQANGIKLGDPRPPLRAG